MCRFVVPSALRRAIAFVCVAGAALCATASPAAAAEKGVVSDMTWGVTPADQDRSAEALRDTGAQWVRLNMSWYWLDAYPGYWEKYDRAVRLARESGAKVLMMFNHSPEWASGSTNIDAPPRDPAAYGEAMRALVEHYRGQVDAYEIWNEPNHRQFWPTAEGPDPAAYAELLKAGAQAVRAADPAAKVVFGGLAHNDYGFLEAAYAAAPDLGDHFDVMAVHPYPFPFSNAPEVVERTADGRISPHSFTAYREIRDVLAAHGDERPIWFTEFGWSSATAGGGVGEALQAAYTTRALELVESDPYVEAAMVYGLRNHYWAADADNWLDSLGLMRVDYSTKPAYHAFKAYQPPAPAKAQPLPAAPVVAPPATAPVAVPPPAAAVEDVTMPPTTAPDPLAPVTPESPISVTIRPTTGRSADLGWPRLRAGRKARIVGRVKGARRGKVNVKLQRRTAGGRWRGAAQMQLRLSRRGRFSTTVRLARASRWRLVVRYSAPGARTSAHSISFRVR